MVTAAPAVAAAPSPAAASLVFLLPLLAARSAVRCAACRAAAPSQPHSLRDSGAPHCWTSPTRVGCSLNLPPKRSRLLSVCSHSQLCCPLTDDAVQQALLVGGGITANERAATNFTFSLKIGVNPDHHHHPLVPLSFSDSLVLRLLLCLLNFIRAVAARGHGRVQLAHRHGSFVSCSSGSSTRRGRLTSRM